MLAVCAERGGLYANATRILDLREPGPEVRRIQAVCDRILVRAREATLPGRRLSEVFAEMAEAYREEGFPGGWRCHHQGGLTGYASREVIATPYTGLRIEPGMAFAFNPSVSSGGTFAKSEETFLLTPDAKERLTRGGET